MDDESRIKDIGGGSLLIAWQLKDKNVVIVGGGEVASQRIESVLTADANIKLISPAIGLHPRTRRFLELREDRVVYVNKEYSGPSDLDGADMVLTAIDDHEVSKSIVAECRRRRVPVNAADIPDLCDFYFGAQVRDGPLQIMISTNGNGPRLASLIKSQIRDALTGKEGEAIEKVGRLRAKLKERAPGVGGKLGRERMKWMSGICNDWSIEELASLDDKAMDNLLDEGWENDRKVPQPTRALKEQSNDILQHINLAIAFLAGAAVATAFTLFKRRR